MEPRPYTPVDKPIAGLSNTQEMQNDSYDFKELMQNSSIQKATPQILTILGQDRIIDDDDMIFEDSFDYQPPILSAKEQNLLLEAFQNALKDKPDATNNNASSIGQDILKASRKSVQIAKQVKSEMYDIEEPFFKDFDDVTPPQPPIFDDRIEPLPGSLHHPILPVDTLFPTDDFMFEAGSLVTQKVNKYIVSNTREDFIPPQHVIQAKHNEGLNPIRKLHQNIPQPNNPYKQELPEMFNKQQQEQPVKPAKQVNHQRQRQSLFDFPETDPIQLTQPKQSQHFDPIQNSQPKQLFNINQSQPMNLINSNEATQVNPSKQKQTNSLFEPEPNQIKPQNQIHLFPEETKPSSSLFDLEEDKPKQTNSLFEPQPNQMKQQNQIHLFPQETKPSSSLFDLEEDKPKQKILETSNNQLLNQQYTPYANQQSQMANQPQMHPYSNLQQIPMYYQQPNSSSGFNNQSYYQTQPLSKAKTQNSIPQYRQPSEYSANEIPSYPTVPNLFNDDDSLEIPTEMPSNPNDLTLFDEPMEASLFSNQSKAKKKASTKKQAMPQ